MAAEDENCLRFAMPCLVILNIYHVMSVCHVTSWYAMSYGLVCGDPPSVLKPQATNREQLNWKICGHEHPIEDIFAFSEQPELVSFPCGRFPRLSPPFSTAFTAAPAARSHSREAPPSAAGYGLSEPGRTKHLMTRLHLLHHCPTVPSCLDPSTFINWMLILI